MFMFSFTVLIGTIYTHIILFIVYLFTHQIELEEVCHSAQTVPDKRDAEELKRVREAERAEMKEEGE